MHEQGLMNKDFTSKLLVHSRQSQCADICTHFFADLQEHFSTPASLCNYHECFTTVSVHLLTIRGYKLSEMEVSQAEQSINCAKYLDLTFS